MPPKSEVVYLAPTGSVSLTPDEARITRECLSRWALDHVWRAIIAALSPEDRRRFSIELVSDDEREPLWSSGVVYAAGQRFWFELPEGADDPPSSVEMRLVDTAKVRAAEILTALSEDRLRAQAAEMFADAVKEGAVA